MSFGMISFGYTWMAMLFACFLLIVLTQQRSILHAIATNGALQRLGMIAYGVYLLHMGVLGLMHGLILDQSPGYFRSLPDALITALSLLTTLAIAALSYRYIEKPIIGFGHGFTYARSCIRGFGAAAENGDAGFVVLALGSGCEKT
jgi:peptidoglycan/LPS O-acetylase OafA/YrhL